MTTGQTKILREQIVACLRNCWPMPMSTDEIARHMPPRIERWDHCCAENCPAPFGLYEQLHVIECHQSWHLILRPTHGRDVYQHLRALEKREIITGTPRDCYDRRRYWSVVADPDLHREIKDLDSAWAAP